MANPIVNWIIVLAALAIGLLGGLGPFDLGPMPDALIDWFDVAGESTFLIGAFLFALFVHRFEVPAGTQRLFFFAAVFFVVAQSLDVLDELRRLSGILPTLIENGARMVGMGTLAAAMLNVLGTMRRAHQEREAFRAASRTDKLTALGNRYEMDIVLSRMVDMAREEARSLSVVFLDVDDFKKANDDFGHAVGDEVLIQLSEIVRSTIRSADRGFRIGGEEFLVALPGTSLAGARIVSERLRQRFGALDVPTHKGPWRGTISLGVAQLREDDTIDGLVKRADDSMYAAKRAGKNRVVLESDLDPKRSRRILLAPAEGDQT